MSDKNFKIAYVNHNNDIKEIYVFVGLFCKIKNINIKEINELYDSFDIKKNTDEDSLLYSIFHLNEIIFNKKNNIPIIFIDEQIYLDDTIENVKKKFLMHYTKKDISYYDLYMFSKQKYIIDIDDIYMD